MNARFFAKAHIYLKRFVFCFYWPFDVFRRLLGGGLSRISPMAGGFMLAFVVFAISAELSTLWFFIVEHLWYHTTEWITNPLAATASITIYGLATAFDIWGGNPTWR